jgi:hypothetical protein
MKKLLLILAILALAGCSKSDLEIQQEKMEIKALVDKARFDSIATERAQRFEEDRTQIKLQEMVSGKICIDTVVRTVTVHDTIKPTFDQMYGKYVNELCVITLKMKKESFTIDPTEHAKNEMNAVTFNIPVDHDYYDKVNMGTDLSDGDVRMGSLLIHGSFSSWSVKVVGKDCHRR